jgi:transaldolase
MTAKPLRVKIFADGANLDEMCAWARKPIVRGFTTNPTLMRQAGVRDYTGFAREALAAIPDRPISFEVFSDDFAEMETQARVIASWAANVYVKIPITNARGEPATPLIGRLSRSGVRVNVTAVLTSEQVAAATVAVNGGAPAFVSVFAGRIADTGRDPMPVIAHALEITCRVPSIEIIWASPREVLNVYQADALGCHAITLTSDLLKKLPLRNKDLDTFSLETVRMFRDDAARAGFSLAAHGLLT